MCKVSISNGNKKVGRIPSVSLLPIVSCPNCKSCAKKCYANKLCRIYPSVKKAYANNWEILQSNPNEYFKQVNDAVKMARFFRWHVSGDIVNFDYLLNMVSIANNNPHCTMLAFTKNWDVVNKYVSEVGELPSNLQIIFSADFDTNETKNPYNMPTAHVILKGCEPSANYKICGGNCSECALNGGGCWTLAKGESVAFYEH